MGSCVSVVFQDKEHVQIRGRREGTWDRRMGILRDRELILARMHLNLLIFLYVRVPTTTGKKF